MYSGLGEHNLSPLYFTIIPEEECYASSRLTLSIHPSGDRNVSGRC